MLIVDCLFSLRIQDYQSHTHLIYENKTGSGIKLIIKFHYISLITVGLVQVLQILRGLRKKAVG